MPRIAVCLLFIAILQNGIQKSSQANETTTEDLTNNKEETTNVNVKNSEALSNITTAKDREALSNITIAKDSELPSKITTAKDNELPSTIEPVKDSDVSSKKEADERSGVPAKIVPANDSDVPQNITAKIKEVDAKPNESKKENVTEKSKSGEISTEKPLTNFNKRSNSNRDFPNNILGPVMEVRSKIENVVFKGVDGAKNFADEAINFLRNTVSNILN